MPEANRQRAVLAPDVCAGRPRRVSRRSGSVAAELKLRAYFKALGPRWKGSRPITIN